MIRSTAIVLALLVGVLVLANPATAGGPIREFAGIDCKDSPTPTMPGQGLVGFFGSTPDPLPATADPFAKGTKTTMYQQYGFAGLRWNTYDLGCGPDAARDPAAVIGTTVANWVMNLPLSLAALTASLTDVAFEPDFLSVFDPMITHVSDALHDTLFASWAPVVLALVGLMLLIKARRAALATSAAAIGWALLVVLVAAVLFRWPVVAGQFADQTVTGTLGSVVNGLNGDEDADPSVSVASNLQESILYTSWLAGELGSADSATARKYGPELFKAQTLTWQQAHLVQTDTLRGKQILETKKDDFSDVADEIKDTDPAAYEHLTGKRSDTRVGYSLLASLATILAVPFLLISALLLIGSFLIVRLAVMLFPAFATLGLFPAARGIVLNVGRTVGAALINAIIFGVGAAVTIAIIGLILNPSLGLPSWFVLVLLPLFTFMMWAALKPFRRLTAMASPNTNTFGDAAGSFGDAGRHSGRMLKKAGIAAAGAYTGHVAAAATINADDQHDPDDTPDGDGPRRVEAEPAPTTPTPDPPSTPPPAALPVGAHVGRHQDTSTPEPAPPGEPPALPPPDPSAKPAPDDGPPAASTRRQAPSLDPVAAPVELEEAMPAPTAESTPPAPTEPEWADGEEIYTLYRPHEPSQPGEPGEPSEASESEQSGGRDDAA